jgi:hypothetical protein
MPAPSTVARTLNPSRFVIELPGRRDEKANPGTEEEDVTDVPRGTGRKRRRRDALSLHQGRVRNPKLAEVTRACE